MRLFSFHPFSSAFPILKLKKDLEKKRRRNLLLARSDTYFILNLLLYNENQILIIRENDFRCDNLFLQKWFILLADYKLSSSSSFSHIFLLSLFFNHPKTPMLQSFKRKTTPKRTKRRGLSFHTIRKIITKIPDGCVTAPCSQHPKTCINTGFKQNCCHCFYPRIKEISSSSFYHFSLHFHSQKVPKSPIL